jgi:triacylglycerol esterase/lipase EstA (alpha/beta hydrolase family)
MRPIVLIHGYSSEGKNTKVEDIYGDLPSYLRDHFGADNLVEISLARWISLNDGISIDNISFALDRALHSRSYRSLLDTGFHVVTHSTGALVVRNWIRLFSSKPSPISNLVHLAGANFGSGLAHVGRG